MPAQRRRRLFPHRVRPDAAYSAHPRRLAVAAARSYHIASAAHAAFWRRSWAVSVTVYSRFVPIMPEHAFSRGHPRPCGRPPTSTGPTPSIPAAHFTAHLPSICTGRSKRSCRPARPTGGPTWMKTGNRRKNCSARSTPAIRPRPSLPPSRLPPRSPRWTISPAPRGPASPTRRRSACAAAPSPPGAPTPRRCAHCARASREAGRGRRPAAAPKPAPAADPPRPAAAAPGAATSSSRATGSASRSQSSGPSR